MMSAFVDEPQIIDVFGVDLLASEKHVPAFLELCGHRGHKPFECVGEARECLLALHLASKRRTDRLLHADLAAIVPSEEQAKELHDQVLGAYNDENGLPPEWNRQLRQLVSADGS